MKYTIFYKDTKIGVLEINEGGQHRYIPDDKGIETAKNEVALIHEMLVKTDWREPIPFFKNRLNNATRFNQEQEIDSHTDFFRMIKE